MRKILAFIVLASISLAANVWFSPNGGARQEIINLIQNTTGNIDVAIYSFTSKEIALSLVAAKKSGRRVRVIADRRQSRGRSSVIDWLMDQMKVKILPVTNTRGIMHHKFMIVNNLYLVTGSYNWSANAEFYNNENMMILTNKELIRRFKEEYNKMWDMAVPYEKKH